MNTVQIAAARTQFPQYATIADAAFIGLPDVVAYVATLPVMAADRSAEAAAAFGSIPLSNGSGAEETPRAAYTFTKGTDGLPLLIGGRWATDNANALTIVKEKYDAEGTTYHGKEKSVKLVVRHNTTNAEYRISGAALQAAFKAAGRPESFGPIELEQSIDTSGGFSKATVKLV